MKILKHKKKTRNLKKSVEISTVHSMKKSAGNAVHFILQNLGIKLKVKTIMFRQICFVAELRPFKEFLPFMYCVNTSYQNVRNYLLTWPNDRPSNN